MSEPAHFDAIAARYAGAVKPFEALYAQARVSLDPIVRDAVVLDIGNGGTFWYDLSLPREIVAMDISEPMLAGARAANVRTVIGDARDLRDVASESVDVVVFALMLHHINGNGPAQTAAMLEGIFREARRVLAPGGKLVVVEALVTGIVDTVQSMLFPVTRGVLRALQRDMIFFFSETMLLDAMTGAFAIEQSSIRRTRLKLPKFYDPLAGSFPGVLVIPGRMSPNRFEVVVAEKPAAATSSD